METRLKSINSRPHLSGFKFNNFLSLIKKTYGQGATNVGDEGGFAPNIQENKDGLKFLKTTIAKAGYTNKLETDIEILLEKADVALKKYKMHAVVANELSTRKEVVILVTESGKVSVYHENDQLDVEFPLIKLLVEKHSTYIMGINSRIPKE